MPTIPAFEYCNSCTPGNYQVNVICVAAGPEQKARMYYAGMKPGEEGVPDRFEGALSQQEWNWNAPGMTEQNTVMTATENNNKILIGPDRIPLPQYHAANECAQSLQGWNNSGLCVPAAVDGTINDAGIAALNAA
jgi:hypothetical protein